MHTVVLCPFSAGTLLWQAESGTWTLSVCVRGTFSPVHGREAVLADPQEPVAADRYVDDDARGSLYAPSDLVPYKPRVDVVLVGSAFAPDPEPVEALVARLSLGSLDKAIGVIGDRTWIEGPDGPEPSAPRPFRVMPLAYERAARAQDNPHGFDLARAPVLGALALPNLEAADDEIGGGRTVGFGPVIPGAGSRRRLLQPEGWAWVEAGGRGPAPAGFDFAFYNAAPQDQQIDVLRGGDTLTLVNLDRRHARLTTRLPEVRPKAFLVPEDIEQGVEIALRCDTLWIDTDRSLLTLSWRGLFAVDSPDEDALGALVIAVETKGRELGYAQIAKILRDGTLSSTADTLTEEHPRARSDDIHDVDSDRVPTPGPFKPKRPLPSGEGSHDEGSAAKLPAAAPPPVVIEAESSMAPPSWEDITASDLVDTASTEEPKTHTRIDARRLNEAAPSPPMAADEPATRPLVRTRSPADLAAADYARIAMAAARGDAARALSSYGLTMGDLANVQRAWAERSASDPAFAQAFAEAMTAAHAGSG